VILLHRDGAWAAVDRSERSVFEERGIWINETAVLGEGIRIGRNASINKGAIIGDGAVIGRGALIGERAIVGSRAVIGAWARIDAGCVVPPGIVIDGWRKMPFIMIAGSVWPLFYLGKDRVDIGCQSASLEEWLSEEGEVTAYFHGFTAEQIREYRVYLEAVQRIHGALKAYSAQGIEAESRKPGGDSGIGADSPVFCGSPGGRKKCAP
jgi:carbonic anhydrase/acetyltransferase-like protein (isoleucine patch superfamily)